MQQSGDEYKNRLQIAADQHYVMLQPITRGSTISLQAGLLTKRSSLSFIFPVKVPVILHDHKQAAGQIRVGHHLTFEISRKESSCITATSSYGICTRFPFHQRTYPLTPAMFYSLKGKYSIFGRKPQWKNKN